MPIITISRGTFSGGKALAECLAQKLGYPCISREVISEAAEHYGVSQAELAAAITKAPSILERMRRDRDRYLAYIRAALCEHARSGNFVYHGHAGHHLLAGVHHVIRVRVVADMAQRVKTAMQRLNMTSRQAESHIRKVDDERRKWTRFLYGVEWEDPANYDVVLNLEYLEISGACATVLRLAELQQFQPSPESIRALESLSLSSFVAAALARNEHTRDGDFRVGAEDGVVTVEGTVRLPETAASVVSVARSVPGVKEVIDQVVVAGIPV